MFQFHVFDAYLIIARIFEEVLEHASPMTAAQIACLFGDFEEGVGPYGRDATPSLNLVVFHTKKLKITFNQQKNRKLG